jgi:hypothetical protein
MQRLLKQGAVPDTWAPNGSSALMLAASCNGTAALRVLLQHGASIELQDALGRTALMFAAGNCACDTLQVGGGLSGVLAWSDDVYWRSLTRLDAAPWRVWPQPWL